MTAVLNITIQLPVVLLAAYLTAHFTVREASREQEAQEQEYVEHLQEAVSNEAELNARSIRRWIPELVSVAKELETFINDKGPSRPGVNPGHAGLTEAAFEALLESPMAARYMSPCLVTALATVHYRLSEGNAVKRTVDAALAEYTATFPEGLPEAYTAAARLHARIEQLLEIYKVLPDALERLIELGDTQDCGEDEQ